MDQVIHTNRPLGLAGFAAQIEGASGARTRGIGNAQEAASRLKASLAGGGRQRALTARRRRRER